MDRQRRSTTAFAVGRGAVCGSGCLKRWRRPVLVTFTSSTARPPRYIARRQVEKGGRGAGDRPLTRRPDDEVHAVAMAAADPSRSKIDARVAVMLLAPLPPARMCAIEFTEAWLTVTIEGLASWRGIYSPLRCCRFMQILRDLFPHQEWNVASDDAPTGAVLVMAAAAVIGLLWGVGLTLLVQFLL